MPIYEYRVADGHRGCRRCRKGIEVIKPIHDEPLRFCPFCSSPVERVFSPVSFRMVDRGPSTVETRIREYEKEGMYSHAAELADKEAEKTHREDLKARAMENYKKAGYRDV
ncbi:MAG: zinc ribbon domain-containing protein [Deltaproteobacteria bacterium]|nr:zinc ribbon domain-containing protein [Deltaproteobacteria bacterium]